MNAGPKRFAKVLLGQALVRSGLWKRTLRMWAERDAVIILTYHRVIETWDETLDYSQPGMVVTAPTFERQVAILKEHFEVVTLGAVLADGNTAGRAGRPRCVVTFDDGWRDNYDLAFPILRRHDLPATEEGLRPLQEVRQRQLKVHHQAVHGRASSFVSDTDSDAEHRVGDFAAEL